ncbi:dephospho-CoA kinase [Legionella oakridgensis]|uniref:Dephospho-CoA kinase n=2 Tax=Legionella oakridgensis TaxID=29423 RepID=W0BFE5_9GAMM|nr:dephospho-CoA kinase [Legionella oakridgensis]AHE67406.1 dephospho-CoA kinase [Legionella oakridgensis ATCC 33761 = DSM 21215]ETO92942.1 dephospho-CoA kinase [Legionella oakridgensis RV-2-2007]KTD43470.1 dephospho-CoA kinase [Legionella oakridgensis]STY20462.1 dephospho-CoA kinase [Legionella longbeachae]
MFCIGLTGNIGSGKSTVAALFAKLGIDVISADTIAKKLTQQGQPAFYKIIEHFGDTIKEESGNINRRQLRQLVFDKPKERQWLENLLHPLIRQEIAREINYCQSPYCIIEIPLLPDKKDYPYLDRILFIQADKEIQIARLIARDQCTRQEAQTILTTQAATEKHLQIADDVLINNGSLQQLKNQIETLHQRYITEYT